MVFSRDDSGRPPSFSAFAFFSNAAWSASGTELKLAWASQPNDEIKLQFLGPSRGGVDPWVTVSCLFPASAGSATIPTSVLALFGAGDGTINLGVQNISRVDAKPWNVELIALTNAVDADGQVLNASARFTR